MLITCSLLLIIWLAYCEACFKIPWFFLQNKQPAGVIGWAIFNEFFAAKMFCIKLVKSDPTMLSFGA